MLEADFSESPECYGQKVKEEDILTAQKHLNLTFSDSYIKFLSAYGSAVMPGHIIYGLAYLSDMGSSIKRVAQLLPACVAQRWVPSAINWSSASLITKVTWAKPSKD